MINISVVPCFLFFGSDISRAGGSFADYCVILDCCIHCWACHGSRWCDPPSFYLFWEGKCFFFLFFLLNLLFTYIHWYWYFLWLSYIWDLGETIHFMVIGHQVAYLLWLVWIASSTFEHLMLPVCNNLQFPCESWKQTMYICISLQEAESSNTKYR